MKSAFSLKPYCIASAFVVLMSLCLANFAATRAPNSTTPVTTAPPTIIVLGDSLSAEYGLRKGTGWVPLLAAQLKQTPIRGSTWQVVNASISGDTTAGGRARLPSVLLAHPAQLLLIELGGNDALRGLPLEESQKNLQAMIEMAQRRQMRVLLLGMQMPPNYGANYAKQFEQMYQNLAKRHKTALVPFLLAGVADSPQAATLFQADRIHPNEAAQAKLLANVWPKLLALLQAAAPTGNR